jgi:hypothetical protein
MLKEGYEKVNLSSFRIYVPFLDEKLLRLDKTRFIQSRKFSEMGGAGYRI